MHLPERDHGTRGETIKHNLLDKHITTICWGISLFYNLAVFKLAKQIQYNATIVRLFVILRFYYFRIMFAQQNTWFDWYWNGIK